MFEATLVAADPDHHRQQRLLLAAAIAISSTSTVLAGLWTLERLGIDRVIGPRQQFELLQFDMLTPPKTIVPPPPPKDDPPNETAGGSTPTTIEETINDDDPTPSNLLTQPQQRSNAIPGPKTSGIPGSEGCPGGLCIGSLPPKGDDGCTGPLCTGTSPLPPKTAPAPAEVEFSALRCLACADPDQAALRKTVAAGQKRRGTVTVKFCVDKNGRVEGSSIKVSRSFGVPAVGRITTDTMKRWRFSPLEIGGKSRRACSRAEFNIRFE